MTKVEWLIVNIPAFAQLSATTLEGDIKVDAMHGDEKA